MNLGGKVYHVTELDSTNDFAKGLLSGAPNGTVVIADSQRKGKGRLGKSWCSPEGGLWFSIILGKRDGLLIPLLAGVAICDALRELGLNVGIKWPNDIVIGTKKIAGILTEIEEEKIILGIGLNLNISQFPEGLKAIATSLFLETGKTYAREEVLKLILGEIEKEYKSLRRGDLQSLLDEWRDHSVTLGREVELKTPKRILRGRAIDIAQDGGLLLEVSDGSVEKVLAGECTLRTNSPLEVNERSELI